MGTSTRSQMLRSILFANMVALVPLTAFAASGSSPAGNSQREQTQTNPALSHKQNQDAQVSRSSLKQPPTHALVKKVQQALNAKESANLKVDGLYGKSTIQSLKQYQRSNGLKVTGVIDNKTKRSLLYM